jgi:hypothetical protein
VVFLQVSRRPVGRQCRGQVGHQDGGQAGRSSHSGSRGRDEDEDEGKRGHTSKYRKNE